MPIFRGEVQAIAAQMAVGRRPRSKVRIRVVGSSSLGWVEAAEAWGEEVEAVVVGIPDNFKDIRQKKSIDAYRYPTRRLTPLAPMTLGWMLAGKPCYWG